MSYLEILHFTGENERRELNQQTPVSIGSHSSNDITIDEEGVDIMHCRIVWGKSGFEAIAAGVDPLLVNGEPMQRMVLKAGDVLRFGTVDLRFRDSENDGVAAVPADSRPDTGLKPIIKEAPPSSKSSATIPAPKSSPGASIPNLDLLSSALDALAAESRGASPSRSKGNKTPPGKSGKSSGQIRTVRSPSGSDSEGTPDSVPDFSGSGILDALADSELAGGVSQRHDSGQGSPSRRSPWGLVLGGGAAALLLAGGLFYFLGNRPAPQTDFDAARQLYVSGNYGGCISAFQKFLDSHPQDALAGEARILLESSRVRQHLSGESPNYEEGMKELAAMIEAAKERDGMERLHNEFADHARAIALGTAEIGRKQLDPSVLRLAEQARELLHAYGSQNAANVDALQTIDRSLQESKEALLKQQTYSERLGRIESSLTAGRPLDALQVRHELLVRYPDFAGDQRLAALVNRAVGLEKSRVTSRSLDQNALTEEEPFPSGMLTLASQGRTRLHEAASGRAVTVVAENSLYGVDMVTGHPLWRREVGFQLPFCPIYEPDMAHVIVFDTRHQELVRLHQDTGKLVWRLPLGVPLAGQPLLTNGILFVATSDARLLTIEIASGRLTGQMTFSQMVSGPVEWGDSERLVVAGNESLVYTLTKQPLACVAVTYTGHPASSVQAPLVVADGGLLLAQNGEHDAELRLLRMDSASGKLSEVTVARVTGRVLNAPLELGGNLFVPSTGERVSTFLLSGNPAEPQLTPGPVYQGDSRQHGPIFLLPAADGQLWMASGSLSRLKLSGDSLELVGTPTASGIATQPPFRDEGYLFNARRRAYTQAVTLTRTNHDELTSDWQVIVGGKILAWTGRAGENLNIAAVTSAGQAFRVTDRQFSEGAFATTPSERLPLNADLTAPLLAATITGERLAVACAEPDPRIWILNAFGKTEASPQLPAAPQAPPSHIGPLVVVPLPGRLHVVRQSGQGAVQDFMLPDGKQKTWVGVVPVSEDRSVAVTTDGVVLLIRSQDAPQPGMAEAARMTLGKSVEHLPATGDGLIALADAEQRIVLLDSEQLEPRGERTLDSLVSNRPWILNGNVYVEEARSRLHCLDPRNELQSKWSLELNTTSVTGMATAGDTLLIALQDGRVLTVQPDNGNVTSTFDARTPLNQGPLQSGGRWFVASADGTLIPVPSPAE